MSSLGCGMEAAQQGLLLGGLVLVMACGGDPVLTGADGGVDARTGGVVATGGVTNAGGTLLGRGQDAGMGGALAFGGGGRHALADGGLTEATACGAASVKAEFVTVEEQVEVEVEVDVEVEVEVDVEVPFEVTEPAPIALYVMLDKSLSMQWSDLWAPAVNAVQGFIDADASAGMDMALQYFPIASGSCSDGSGYDSPAVEVGRLPGAALDLIGSLASAIADGSGTPIEGALRGVTEYCKAFQQEHLNEKCVAVFVTDGKPQSSWGCESDHDKLANIAKAAFDDFGVRTFAVGLQGAEFELLDKIAIAGGATDCDGESARFACDVSDNADRLAVVLEEIRDTVTTVETRIETRTETQTQTRTETYFETRTSTEIRTLDCTWQLPAAAGDTDTDINKINVRIGGSELDWLSLGRVDGADACADRGWYYNDALAPSQIIACPSTCTRIETEGFASVDILLGCETEILLE